MCKGRSEESAWKCFSLHGQSHDNCMQSPCQLNIRAFRMTYYCSVRWGCRWSITIACTEWAGLMLCFVGSTWRSCALSCQRTRSFRQRAGHPALPALRWHPRQAGRMVWVPRLGLREVAGDNRDRFRIRYLRSHLGLRSRTRGWRHEPWCLIVVRHCCRCLWMFRALICGQSGPRYLRRSQLLSLPNLSSNSGGGGRFA